MNELGRFQEAAPQEDIKRIRGDIEMLLAQGRAGRVPRGYKLDRGRLYFGEVRLIDSSRMESITLSDKKGKTSMTWLKPVDRDEAGMTRERLRIEIGQDELDSPTMTTAIVRGGAHDLMPEVSVPLDAVTSAEVVEGLDRLVALPDRSTSLPKRIVEAVIHRSL